ncbi:MAG: peptidylprolyl isomerase [Clostridia bacterium]|nr:peptidylprolyl isomerase [Clostridia bacterium]
MKRIVCILLSLVLLTVALAACGRKAPSMNEIDMSPVDISKAEVTDSVTDYVLISVANYGDILIRLYPDVAPETVENFKALVSQKFYDGLTFHRIIKDFMIQGGDPKGNGTGDSGKNITGEFSANGFENNLLHNRGVVSMARGDDKNSASCQFFIVHKTSDHLDGNYAAFGYVVAGMDVVDKIASVPVWPDDNSPKFTTVKISTARFAEIKA